MFGKRRNILVVAFTVALYAATAVAGLWVIGPLLARWNATEGPHAVWKSAPMAAIPDGPLGDSVRFGAEIFDNTAVYASRYTRAQVSCTNCHAEGGIQPYAAPMVGLTELFPMYSKRAGRKISLKDRINECFVRSENGKPLPLDAPEMLALVHYVGWLSPSGAGSTEYVGRGLLVLPGMKPDAAHGSEIYLEQCAGCHGDHGQGSAPQFPPLWGPESFNDGAGMNQVSKMAAFVKQNMPQNRKGILSAQEAYDVAAFIHQQPRPAFNQTYKAY